jgi:mannose-6-phosphate isomerase
MFVGLTNTPRDYAWGSRTAIADLLGTPASGRPEAELWLGTHPGSPSILLDSVSAATRLTEIATLPFLLKVLAADAPLSLQAHPTTEQAAAGFARENAAGVALDDPLRNYKDPHHKPELIYALSDEFHSLCGFRPVAVTRELLAPLAGDPLVAGLLARLTGDDSLCSVFEWLISRDEGVDELIARVVELAPSVAGVEFETVATLAAGYPGDPGIVISLLLNHAVLSPGEALYLPAGNIHAYLSGVGIELMSSSDNVLRGGLTPKHVDVPELLAVLDFTPTPLPYLVPEEPSAGVRVFRPDVPDFELVVVTPAGGSARYAPATDSIALCTSGELDIRGAGGSRSLARGESVYVSAEESPLEFSGTGTVFLATAQASGPSR